MKKRTTQILTLFFTLNLFFVGCSGQNQAQRQAPAGIDINSIREGEGRVVNFSEGVDIYVQKRDGILYFPVEGTFSPDRFSRLLSENSTRSEAERREVIALAISKFFSQVKQYKGIAVNAFPEVGYFTFELPYTAGYMDTIKVLQRSHSALINPVPYDLSGLSQKLHSEFKQDPLKVTSASEGVKGGLSSRLSGIERIHALGFVEKVQAEVGNTVQIDGSTVRVGVTDTGITLNHPAFRSQDGSQIRIAYMRDFTREGRVYFSKDASFSVSIPAEGKEEDLLLSAQVIVTPKLPNSPLADRYVEVKNQTIRVSPELKALLIKPGLKARLGILDENVFQSEAEPTDISGSGHSNDKFYFIFIPGLTSEDDVVYADFTGKADFRHSMPVKDWNRTKMTLPVFSELIGFDFRDDKLPTSKGDDVVPVKSISIVGFDPGDHGTHVSGIIAGQKIISNDSSSTLARGVAPGSTLFVNRVCSNNSGCNATEAMIDVVLQGHVDVVNMSLGGLSPFNNGYGVEEIIINRLTSMYNVLFMVAAGNSGPGRQTVGSPSTARLALSIGASATPGMITGQYEWPSPSPRNSTAANGSGAPDLNRDFMLFFSSRGPSGSGGFQPNIVAPGTELSSIQLNSALGAHGGMDVYWGTSMATPTAAGAYALFLDSVRKYNLKFPEKALPTDVGTLRQVLLQSARPFDVSRFDPETGEKQLGQYTWVDEGMGMIDLEAAWKKLLEVRDGSLSNAVTFTGGSVPLDYQVLVSMKSPTGEAYDGSVGSPLTGPIFGEGIYLNYFDTETLRQVGVSRKLPDFYNALPFAADLTRQLKTTRDEFVLKVLYYGSDLPWLKVGTVDSPNCSESDVSNLMIYGTGSTVSINPSGGGSLNLLKPSTLNVCINRSRILRELSAGDHGALIFAYRTVDGKQAILPSFTVPVYITVPHKKLANASAYVVSQEIESFGVQRNYVVIPKGATAVKVTLEVPLIKKSDDGLMASGEKCSGVELMALTGSNVSKPFKTREEARVSNCDGVGRILDADSSRKLTFVVSQPKSGIWDLPVFGSYKFTHSQFSLRVDYLKASSNTAEIRGGLTSLSGSMKLTLDEASFDVSPDPALSQYEVSGLESEVQSQVAQGTGVFVSGGLGGLREYPSTVKSAQISIGNSPGNDIDLTVFECPKGTQDPTDSACTAVGSSNGPTDEESVTFTPQSGKIYAARVDGATVKDEGNFVLKDRIFLASEKGTVSVASQEPGNYVVNYSWSESQVSQSKFFGNDFFKSGKFKAVGTLKLLGGEKTEIYSIPVQIGL